MSKHVEASGKCSGVPNSDLIIATDASVRGGLHSRAFISTAGHWGWVAARYASDVCKPYCAEATELLAVWYGLKAHSGVRGATVRLDSQGALRHLLRWQRGDTAFPTWYNTRRSWAPLTTLVDLQQRVTADDGLKFEHIKGHSGDLLNEAADALARIGTERGYSAEEGEKRSADLAASFLLSYRQAQMGPA